jgi:hypothetical protein
MSEEKGYPEYSLYDFIEDDSECWERYAERIKEMRNSGRKFKFPLNKNSRQLVSGGGLHKSLIVEMSPKRFLNLAKPKEYIRGCSLDYLLDAFDKGDPKIDPLLLSVFVKDVEECISGTDKNKKRCMVVGHEGRHRAEIAMDLNIDRVPVIIDYAPDYTLITESGNVDYKTVNEFERRFRDKEFETGNAYDEALKMMGDKWKHPDKCSVDNLVKEKASSNVERNIEILSGLSMKRKMKRIKYGLE